MIYNNRIAETVKDMGFKGIFTEGVDRILEWRSPNYLYEAPCGIKVLLRNYMLSDDIGFRFSSPNWEEYPLTADKYASWLANSKGDCIVIYIDYETFGEHHWKETGIFEFLRHLPEEIGKYPHLEFSTPSEIVEKCKAKGEFSVLECSTISWADSERDTSAWLGNKMQRISFERLKDIRRYVGKYLRLKYEMSRDMESKKKVDMDKMIEYKIYKNLQTSDNFYYQCTKGLSDMDVHSYFSHFETPYDAYATYMDVIYDFKSYLLINYIAGKCSKRIVKLKKEINKLKNIVASSDNKKKEEELISKIKHLEGELLKKNKEIEYLLEENNKLIKEILFLKSKENIKDKDKKKDIEDLKDFIIGS